MKKRALLFLAAVFTLAATLVSFQAPVQSSDDPIVRKIIEIGRTNNQVMTWNDYASNRFGARETGTNAYNDAAEWAVWQFRQWGLEAELDEAGELPVGFNRGPWFGRMIKPNEKALWFGTPSFTAGTKGVQRGHVVILKADPFSIPGRNPKPEDVEKKKAAVEAAIAEVRAAGDAFKGAWVLIGGENSGFARDGRRATADYSDSTLIPPLSRMLDEAGALGTIQLSKTEPFRIMDGHVTSWDKLPVLPDIKLAEPQFKEIKALVEKGEKVELEFDIRNWFKMGPVKYHNVVAMLRGTTYPDEYIVIGGHFDCFSGATGAVDDGSGFAPGMEALRLITAAGGRPKRSIIIILFAAEESGLVGSQAWLRRHPHLQNKIFMMINRDGSPSAITGAAVPETWYADFQKIGAPLSNVNPKWPFKVERTLPRAHATSAGGTDSSSFEMKGIPTLGFRTQTNYNYQHAWHTLADTYQELVPYTEHQQHSALVTAVVAYGAANLEKTLPRDGVYLNDGIYAAFTVGAGDAPKQFMTTIDYLGAPLQAANFIRIVEGKTPAGGPQGMGGRGPGGPGRRPEIPPIGTIEIADRMIKGLIVSDAQKSVAVASLPLSPNAGLKHDGAGVLGLSGPNAFYLTLQKNAGLDAKFTAIGRTIAGMDLLAQLKKGEPIRAIRIVRVGQAARDFKTDEEAFQKLLKAGK
ncbi:MAG: M20/M25/M40 family metallo-hydrolase [Candidatus Aminicenantes bacterium]|nr:M20/M25/M40 family metallo-hydrolase [Candidatus Aminicenantes bacterium]